MPYPWNPPHAFLGVEEYLLPRLLLYRSLFLNFCGQKYAEELVFDCFPTETKVYLTHGDFLPGGFKTYRDSGLGDRRILFRVLRILPNA
jgi:hypothetical protein